MESIVLVSQVLKSEGEEEEEEGGKGNHPKF